MTPCVKGGGCDCPKPQEKPAVTSCSLGNKAANEIEFLHLEFVHLNSCKLNSCILIPASWIPASLIQAPEWKEEAVHCNENTASRVPASLIIVLQRSATMKLSPCVSKSLCCRVATKRCALQRRLQSSLQCKKASIVGVCEICVG